MIYKVPSYHCALQFISLQLFGCKNTFDQDPWSSFKLRVNGHGAPRGSSTLSKIKGKYAKSLCEWVVNRVGWDVGDEFLGGRWLGIGGWRKEVTGGMA